MAYNKTPNNEAPELIEKVVYLNRVSKTVKGGRVMKFSALVVVGDGKGTVGYGLGKAAEVSEAILKGIADAKKNMVKVSLAGDTIPHDVIGIFGAGTVLLKPAPRAPALSPAALSVPLWRLSASRTSAQSACVPTTLRTLSRPPWLV